MKRLTTVLFLCATPVAAATIVPQFFELFVPAHVWGVNDSELMMATFNDGRPSFRRPGDEQCLAKFDEGPVPCDEVELFHEFEDQAPPAQEDAPELFALAPADDWVFNPWQQPPICCYGGDGHEPEPPVVVPAVSLPPAILLMLVGFLVWFGLAMMGRMK